MGVADITNYLNMGLIILFVVILVALVLFFLRGLLRGWRYGTYRVIAFAVLITIAFLTLGVIADAIGNWDMTSFGMPAISYNITNNGTTTHVSAAFGTPYGAIASAIEQTLKAYDVAQSPEQITAYASALAKSIVMLLTLFLDGFLLGTFGNLFVMILWHVAFKHTIPKDKRQEAKKKGKLISAFEELAIGLVVGSMLIFPLSSMVNSIAYGWNDISDTDKKASLRASNQTYDTVQAVVDTYNDSLFSKVFFAWTKDDTGTSFDMQLTKFLTKGSFGEAEVSAINEFSSLSRIASLAVEGGVLSQGGFDQSKLALFAVSEYAPEMLRALGRSGLVTGVLPYVLNVAENMDAVAPYIKTKTGIDFTNKDFKYDLTFDKLADIYDGLIKDDVLKNALVDENGKFGTTEAIVTAAFSKDSATPMEDLFAVLDSESPDYLPVLDAVIESVFYVLSCKDATQLKKNPDAFKGKITISDFFPTVPSDFDADGDGVPDSVPASFASIDWGKQLAYVYDSIAAIAQTDTNLIPTLTHNLGQENYSIDGQALIKGVVNNLSVYGERLFGVTSSNVQAAESSTSTAGETTGKSLLDCDFIENAMPKLFDIIASTVNTALALPESKAITLDSVKSKLFVEDWSTRVNNVKTEFGNLYKVLSKLTSSDKGKALLLDLQGLPGIYFDPKGQFVGVDRGLLDALTTGLEAMDQSEVASAIMPKAFQAFFDGDNSPLKSLGLTGLKMDFTSNVGANLAKLIRTYSLNQEVVSYLISNSTEVTTSNADQVLRGLLSFQDDQGNHQISNLLKGLATNTMINPAPGAGEKKNSNLSLLINVLLEKTGQTGSDTLDDLKTALDGVGDIASEIDQLDGVLQLMSDGDVLGKILAFQSSPNFANLATVDFQGLLDKMNQSAVFKAVIGGILDKAILKNENITYFSDLPAGVSFKNVTDWGKEGAALQALLNAAGEIGDLSNIDYFHSDPNAISSILKALSGSDIFVSANKDANGKVTSYNYLFPRYFANKIVSYLGDANAKSAAPYFADPYDATTFGFFKLTFESVGLSYSFDSTETVDAATVQSKTDALALSNITTAQITSLREAWDTESVLIKSLLSDMMSLDGFTIFSDTTDYRTINPNLLNSLLNSVASSKSFGPILTYNLFKKAGDTLKDSEPALASDNYNLDYLLRATSDQRNDETADLSQILDAVIDPVYGLLDSSTGQIKKSEIDMQQVSADFFVNPVLNGMAQSKVFNTVDSHKTTQSYSAYEQEYASLLVRSKLYSSVDKVYDIIDEKFRTNQVSWAGEIDQLCTLLNDVKATNLDLKNLNFNSLFSSSNSAATNEANRVLLATTLKQYNKCATLYPSLPTLLKTSVDSMVTEIAKTQSDITSYGLGDANFTYAGANAYDDTEMENLSYIVEESLLGFNVSDIKTIDGARMSDLLSHLVQSKIFNTSATSGQQPVAQKVMSKALLAGGSLNDIYYFATNPKDTDGKTRLLYTSSSEKADYLAKTYFDLASLDPATFQSNLSLIKGDTGSLESVLKAMQTGDIADGVKNGSIDSLSESDLKVLLHALNNCKLYQDCVPNALAKFLSGSSLTIDGINFNRADPYYCYYWSSAGDAINLGITNPDFTVAYDAKSEGEIDRLATILSLVNKNKTLLSNLTSTAITDEATISEVIRPLLNNLADSFVFHRGLAYQGSHTLLGASSTTYGLYDDLTVFEQMIFMVYDQSSLAKQAYDISYDNSYLAAAQKNGTDAYKEKLYDWITKFNDKTLTGVSHVGIWADEINALTIDSQGKGLLKLALDYGFLSSGVSGMQNATTFKNLPPEKIEAVALALNRLDIVKDTVPYSVAGLIEDALGFARYSELSESAILTSGATSYTSKTTIGTVGHIETITVTSASAPEVSISFDGTNYVTLTATGSSSPYPLSNDNGVSTLTVSGNTYSYAIDNLYPLYFQVTSSSAISDLSYKFNTSDYLLSQSEYAADGVGILKNFAEAIWEGTAYLSFTDQSAVSTYLVNSDSGKLKAFLDFVSSDAGFYTRHFYGNTGNTNQLVSTESEKASSLFASRDVTIAKLLNFSTSVGGTNVSVNLGKYLGKDVAGVHRDLATYVGAEGIFASTGYNSAKESVWLKTNLLNVISAEAAYATSADTPLAYGGTTYTIPRVHMIVETFLASATSSTYTAFKAAVPAGYTADSDGYLSRFGAALSAGLIDEFIGSEYTYASSGNYFTGFSAALPSSAMSAGSPTNRLNYLSSPECPNLYGATSADNELGIIDDFVNASSSLLLSKIPSGMNLSASEKADVVLKLTAIDTTLLTANEATKLLAHILYLGTYYDYFVNRNFFHGTILISSNPVNTYSYECDFPNPLGNGYATGAVGTDSAGKGAATSFSFANVAAQIVTA